MPDDERKPVCWCGHEDEEHMLSGLTGLWNCSLCRIEQQHEYETWPQLVARLEGERDAAIAAGEAALDAARTQHAREQDDLQTEIDRLKKRLTETGRNASSLKVELEESEHRAHTIREQLSEARSMVRRAEEALEINA